MEQLELIPILDTLEPNIRNFRGLESKSGRLCQHLMEIRTKYAAVDTIGEPFQETYDSLVDKGTQLNANYFRTGMDAKQLFETISRYLRYLDAAYGDLSGRTASLTIYYRLFLFCSIFVLLLAPFMVSPFLALIFLVPIFFAMKGIKQRSKLGHTLSLAIGIGGLITSALTLKYAWFVVTDYAATLSDFVAKNGMGEQISQFLMILICILGAILLLLTILFLYHAYKVRDLFI